MQMRAYKITVPALLALTALLSWFLGNYSYASLPEANEWTNLNPATHPPVTANHAMAYNSLHDVMVLFGGYMGEEWPYSMNETWVYDYSANTWTNMDPTTAPFDSGDHAMVYDSDNDLVVCYTEGMTWVYNYSANTWTNMNPATSPRTSYGPVMVYDSTDHVVILLDNQGDTWVYEYLTNTWTNMNPTTSPTWREGWSAMVYDSINNVAVLFGGYGDDYLDDTWVYNYSANTWTNMNPTTHPTAREGHAMAYDSHDGVVILFGGSAPNSVFSDTWTYDVSTNTWTEKNPSTYPPARGYFSMTYNSNVDKVILFGGWWWTESPWESGSFNDTWAYDYTSTFTLKTFPTPFSLADYNTFIIVPISDPHGPCGAAHTMDTMGGVLIANRLGLEGAVVETAMDSYSYISTYDFDTAEVTMTDTTSNLIVLASPGVNQVAYYYNELTVDGTRVLPVLFLRDVSDYLYVQSSGNEYRIEYDGVTVTAEYGVIQIYKDGDRYVLLVYGLGGESSMATAKVLAEYDLWSLTGTAAIVKYYDSDADGYLDTITIAETVS